MSYTHNPKESSLGVARKTQPLKILVTANNFLKTSYLKPRT